MFSSVGFLIFFSIRRRKKQKPKNQTNKKQLKSKQTTKKHPSKIKGKKIVKEELQGHKFRKYEASLKKPQNGSFKLLFHFVLKFNPRVRRINYSPAFNSAAFILFS